MVPHPDAVGRFAGRTEDYVRGRPDYPPELFDEIVRLAAPRPGDRVADLGAGTGISSAPWLERGFEVVAVEPDAAMRAAAMARLGGHRGFRAVDGRAEATGLPDASVSLVFAAQAFHWFEPVATRAELRRILRDPPWVALVWNARRSTGSPFIAGYEALLDRFGTDYHQVGHRGVDPARLAALFGGPFETRRYANYQDLDWPGLRARLLSSSYVPADGEPRHDEMMNGLEELWRTHRHAERVRLDYDCDLFLGRLAERARAG